MTDVQYTQRPAWQTDELQDEWVEDHDEDGSEGNDNTVSSLSQGTRSISMTTPLAGVFHVISGTEDTDTIDGCNQDRTATTTDQAGGTFLVKQDIPAMPLLPQTPGRNNKKGPIKDFFSPMPLEKMFEPPSPPPQCQTKPTPKPNQPAVSSRLTREYIPDDNSLSKDEITMPNMPASSNNNNNNGQFTFTVPRQTCRDPQAQSTPLPPPPPGPVAPMTDPRLKLFQFQYDTFTREHLSAIVDSIAVNLPSGDTNRTPTVTPSNGSSYLSPPNYDANNGNISHLRAAKRLKLSPQSDYAYGEGDGEGASIARPKLYGKDYVGESRKMMEQIKSARDFSTVSTSASALGKEPAGDGGELAHEEPGKAEGDYVMLFYVLQLTSSLRYSTPRASDNAFCA